MALTFCLFTQVQADGEVFPTGGACIEKGKKRSKIVLCAVGVFFSFKQGEQWCLLREYKHPPCINEDGEYYCEGYGPACNECPMDLPAYRA